MTAPAAGPDPSPGSAPTTTPAGRAGPAGPQLRIDLGAVAANTRLLADRAVALMAVVKADGFGHGAADVARTVLAEGAIALGVTTLEDRKSVV